MPDVPARAIEAPASLPPSRSPWSASHCTTYWGILGLRKAASGLPDSVVGEGAEKGARRKSGRGERKGRQETVQLTWSASDTVPTSFLAFSYEE